MKDKSQSERSTSEEFERFKNMAKKLVAVSKKEIERRTKEVDAKEVSRKKAA